MATGVKSNQERESNRKKFSNWLQCVNSLNETKTALHDHVLEIWNKEIMSWDEDLRHHLPRFLICVSEDRVNIRYKEDKKGKRERKPEWFCKCEHSVHCNAILKNLLSLQRNPGPRIIWNNELCGKLAKEKIKIEPDKDNDDDMENIPRVETSMLALFLQMLFAFIGLTSIKQDAPDEVMPETINYEDIVDGCRQEHIWCIANMFMQQGNNKTEITNTEPSNTDASMFFRMMQNCKLFEIEDENYLYEDILSCRNRLHHSANNRVSKAEAAAYLNTMITFLNQFEQVPKCKDTIQNIEKMLKETIMSVSVPDKTLKALSEKALILKKSALEVDREIDRSGGFTSEETNGLLEKTTKELQKISYQPSRKQLSNIESNIQENSQCTADEYVRMTDPGKHFENMAKLVKTYAEKEDILEALTEQLNPLLDQIIEDASGKDEEIKESLEDVYEQEKHESEREKEEKMPIASDDTADQSLEAVSDFGEDLRENRENNVDQETNGTELDNASDNGSDTDYEETKANNFEKTKTEEEDIDVQIPDMEAVSDNLSTSDIDGHPPHVWSVIDVQQYNIKMEGDSTGNGFFTCCRISSTEILLADRTNKRLKRLNDTYTVTAVLELNEWPFDLCYIGNSECVVALPGRKLLFVDVRDEMELTRSVDINHDCSGLTFHDNQLYAIDEKSVYVYNIDGTMLNVVYTHRSHNPLFRQIAVSDNGDKIYITDLNTGLVTIDPFGNYMQTFFDEFRDAWGVCVDGKGHVLVCDCRSTFIFQISHDGKQKIGTVKSKSDGQVDNTALYFDRQNGVLITAGTSGNITVLKLQ